jgi:hypothetical protein
VGYNASALAGCGRISHARGKAAKRGESRGARRISNYSSGFNVYLLAPGFQGLKEEEGNG